MKKKQLIAATLLAMKILTVQIALAFIFAFSVYAHEAGAQAMLEKTFTITVNDAALSKVIHLIEKKTGAKFLFSTEGIQANRKIACSCNEKKLKVFFDEVLQPLNIGYKITEDGQKILLYPLAEKTANTLNVAEKTETLTNIADIISGTITNEKGLPMAGVSVIVKGEADGTVTNDKGEFRIKVSAKNATLIISYIGYQTQEIIVGNKTAFAIRLTAKTERLEDVVIVGYGTQKKVNLTGAVGSVQMDDMKSRPLTNAGLALQGTVSGVYALQASGKPGGDGAVINIRGVGTLNNSDPLVLIDGFPGNLTDVSANDIKSISVLKDAASASIYGNRAANGVILITTIRGSVGKLNVSYSNYFGTQQATSLPKVLNAVDYTTLYDEAQVNSGVSVLKYSQADIAKYAAHNDPMYPDVNYFNVYYNKAKIQSHRINVTGGSENLQYAFMVGNLDQGGILAGGNYKKTDFRANVDAYLLKDKKLRISTKIAGNKGERIEPRDEWQNKWYATTAPVYPLINSLGQWIGIDGGNNYYGETNTGSTSITKRYAFNGQVEAEYHILKDLSAQVTYGFNVTSSNTNAFHANVLIANSAGATKTLTSDLSVSNGLDVQTLMTSLLKYQKKIGKHEFNLLGGYSEEAFNWEWESGYRSKFLNNNQRLLSLGDPSTQTNNAGASDLGLQSVFGRLNYVYDQKYLFEANVRRDGSSRFAEGRRWGTFPSFSAGWVMSKENFMKNINWLDLLKLRASWGQLGNQNINTLYAASSVLSTGQNYSLGNTLYPGVATTSLANTQTTWETSTQTNIGLDLGIKRSFDISVDYFIKKTTGILMQLPIPVTLGDLAPPFQNVGAVENRGLELIVTHKQAFSNGLKLKSTLSLAHIVNKVTNLAGRSPIINGPKALVEGYAINSFYGYAMDGIYQISDFTWQNNSDPNIAYANRNYTLKPGVVSVANYNATPGDIKFKDINGDGKVTMDKDRTVIGKQFPDLNYSLNLNAEWKQFDFGVFFQGVMGIQGYTYYEVASEFSNFSNSGDWWKNRWTPATPSNTMPKVSLDDARRNIHSSFYMENAAYLRLKNIELGYTLNKSVLSKIGINSVRVYGNIQNAFTITKFKGFDPEQPTGETRAQAYPQVRIFSFGINANF